MKAALRDYYMLWRMALGARQSHANAFLLIVTGLAALAVGLLVWLRRATPAWRWAQPRASSLAAS